MGNILLISEHPKYFDGLIFDLKTSGFDVFSKRHSSILQRKLLDHIFDFILFELKSSFQMNTEYLVPLIKTGTVPVFCFGNISEQEEISYYLLGVQEIIRPPYNTQILSHRISSIIKLLEKSSRLIRKLKFGQTEIDLYNRLVVHADSQIKLTSVEVRILKILFQNKNHIVEKDAIIHYAWDDDKSATDNALSIHITRLRNKIEKTNAHPIIDTIWGAGYRLNVADTDV